MRVRLFALAFNSSRIHVPEKLFRMEMVVPEVDNGVTFQRGKMPGKRHIQGHIGV